MLSSAPFRFEGEQNIFKPPPPPKKRNPASKQAMVANGKIKVSPRSVSAQLLYEGIVHDRDHDSVVGWAFL